MGGGGGGGGGGVGPGAEPQPEFESNLENVAVHIFPAPPVTHSLKLCTVGLVRTYSKKWMETVPPTSVELKF